MSLQGGIETVHGEQHGAAQDPSTRNGVEPEAVGRRVREERLRQQVGVRELARRVGVSASLISQVELGKASPSVGTLYSIVNELGLSLDELLLGASARQRRSDTGSGSASASASVSGSASASASGAGDGERRPSSPPEAEQTEDTAPSAFDPVVRAGAGKTIQLAAGVQWQRLTPQSPQDVDFLEVDYEVGGESCPEDSLMRHSGYEYGHVLSGRLGVTIGFDTHELAPGDSISFDSTMPHRLFTIGREPVRAIWFVVGRRGDPRVFRTSGD